MLCQVPKHPDLFSISGVIKVINIHKKTYIIYRCVDGFRISSVISPVHPEQITQHNSKETKNL